MESTIVKGVSVLELLVRNRGPVRLSAIASELKMPKSGVHRLLGTFIELGFVRQDEDSGRYSATLKLWEWGQNIISDHPAKRAAAPYMEELHRLTQETINLLVLDGDEVLFVDKILAPRPLRFSTQPGSRALAIMTAPGKAMLAHEPDAEEIIRQSIATRERAKGVDINEVLADLEEVRAKGYTSANGSWTVGICSYGAPIMGRNGRAAAAISVTAPTERVDEAKHAQIVEALLYTCARIAETVGQL
ncbi:IclR family transcriptional regulator [Sphingopyxis sp. JAI128]|jgi:DNA-binding IclR family transcriptional regulator|uniref:IclR family transcriptional regulator n=1 Tax=Sphingopyxis sp. JAI128 TaxID=2723066 RepID=UPI001611EF86|nr:IclR family transcriptional regulator [Sphingopyxis sp. JAI128]MBB6427142.1 DNA-binding IclR family transcriptional regulator [Sphingopyxis sp. JAI128]